MMMVILNELSFFPSYIEIGYRSILLFGSYQF